MSYQPSSYPPPPPAATPVARPLSIRNAVWLMYLGAALSLISIIVGIATKDSTLDAVRRQLVEDGRSPADVDAAMNAASAVYTGTVVVGSIFVTLLWLWMAWKNGQGRKWARIVATVLFALSTLSLLAAVTGVQDTGAANLWMSIIMWLVGLAAIFFLWRRDSTEYFERMSTRA